MQQWKPEQRELWLKVENGSFAVALNFNIRTGLTERNTLQPSFRVAIGPLKKGFSMSWSGDGGGGVAQVECSSSLPNALKKVNIRTSRVRIQTLHTFQKIVHDV